MLVTRALKIIVSVALGSGFWLAAAGADAQGDIPSHVLDAHRIEVKHGFGRRPDDLPESSRRDIILRFGKDVTAEPMAAIIQENQCWVVQSCDPGNCHLVRIPEWQTPERMAEAFLDDNEVEYAELNYYASATFVPDDEFYSFQWHLDNAVTGRIRMEAAWDLQRGDPNIIIAVLDTGVAFEDFDIFRQAPDRADTSCVPGFDFVNEDTHPNDDHGHGTHVAGTIAQSTDNDAGVAGVAFGCSIMPVKVLGDRGTGDHFTIARGGFFAVDNGARIIDMSLGSPSDSRTLRDAIAEAYRRGAKVVCAAGNDLLANNLVNYPAAYDDVCVAVGTVRYDLTKAPYSNTGSYVDVVAPGGDLRVDQNGDGFADGVLQQTSDVELDVFAYWFLQGTSMATPHVSGLAALLASRGVTDPDKTRKAIERRALDLAPAGWDEQHGWGFVDARAALGYRITGDLNENNIVDAKNLAAMSGQWLQSARSDLRGDLNGDWRVNLSDLATRATAWDR